MSATRTRAVWYKPEQKPGADGLHCPDCQRPQSHHGLCRPCQSAADRADELVVDPTPPEDLPARAPAQEEPVRPLMFPLALELGNLLEGL